MHRSSARADPPVRGPRGTAELAAVLQLLREHTLEPEVIVIDGPVHLDAAEKPGWGRQLFDALGGRSAVIGISTRAMPGLPTQFEVWRDETKRGRSSSPAWASTWGRQRRACARCTAGGACPP